MRVLIIGCGYTGLPLGRRLADLGHEVYGMRRTEAARAEIESHGLKFLKADVTRLEELKPITVCFDSVVNLVSSSKGGPEEYSKVYLEGTRNILEWLAAKPPNRYVYTSSTSVYGQIDGSWVNENSPAEPQSATGKILVETEDLLLRSRHESGFPALVLRVAGIYGPGRGHLFQQFLRGEARIHGDGGRFLNMIHLHDLVGVLAHIVEAKTISALLYNIVDDEPVTELDFFNWLSRQLARPLPPFANVEDLARRKRGYTSKKVSNAVLKAELGYGLDYPTFREGYRGEIGKLTRPE